MEKIVCSRARLNIRHRRLVRWKKSHERNVKLWVEKNWKIFILPTWTRWKGALVALEYVSIMNFHSLNLKIVWYRTLRCVSADEFNSENFNSINFYTSNGRRSKKLKLNCKRESWQLESWIEIRWNSCSGVLALMWVENGKITFSVPELTNCECF